MRQWATQGYIMKGTITVKSIQSPVTTPAAAGGGIDTVGVLMVPTQGIDKYMQDIKNAGLTVDSGHSFKDLRGGQKRNRGCADTLGVDLRRKGFEQCDCAPKPAIVNLAIQLIALFLFFKYCCKVIMSIRN